MRYRRPAGSMPPLTDAVGRLLAVDPTVRVQTKTGTIVEFSPVDVVALRVLTDAPVRTAAIRALEHAAAAAWPGVERTWLDGWLLRAGHGAVLAANSAVPLDISAHTNTITEISAWYASRDLQPWLAVPDRLLPLPADLAGERREQVLVRDVSTGEPDRSVTLLDHPDDTWLRLYHQRLPLDMATPVIDGELAFGSYLGVAVARAAVTDAPDGTRWVGLSAMCVPPTSNPRPAPLAANCGKRCWAGERAAARPAATCACTTPRHPSSPSPWASGCTITAAIFLPSRSAGIPSSHARRHN